MKIIVSIVKIAQSLCNKNYILYSIYKAINKTTESVNNQETLVEKAKTLHLPDRLFKNDSHA